MFHFICNVCSRQNEAESLRRETPVCAACGSNVRIRSLIRMLSVELFGRSLPLIEFPRLPQIRGLGLSDDWRYARILAEKLGYINTYFDREPFLDITKSHPEQYGVYDFMLSSEVFEHVPAPVEDVFAECFRLLKPNGFLCMTVPFATEGETREHYPDLHEFATVNLAGRPVLVNRRKDGIVEVHENVFFHGGVGATLEMRMFAQADLAAQLEKAGFGSVEFDAEQEPVFGIYPEGNCSLPLIARKKPFVLNDGDIPVSDAMLRELQIVELRAKVAELQLKIADRETQLRGVAESGWLRLGRRFGVGPELDQEGCQPGILWRVRGTRR